MPCGYLSVSNFFCLCFMFFVFYVSCFMFFVLFFISLVGPYILDVQSLSCVCFCLVDDLFNSSLCYEIWGLLLYCHVIVCHVCHGIVCHVKKT